MSTESILRAEEGKSLKLYPDTEGVVTIGIGYNIEKRGLPDDIVEELFKRDMMRLRADAQQVPEYAGLDIVRQGVIERMVFQMGVAGVLAFVDFRADLAAKRWVAAGGNILNSRWAKQTSARAKREAARIIRGIE